VLAPFLVALTFDDNPTAARFCLLRYPAELVETTCWGPVPDAERRDRANGRAALHQSKYCIIRPYFDLDKH